VESGQLTPSAVAAGLPHAQDPESVAIDWHIYHTIAAMAVNGLGRRRDAEVCSVLCLFLAKASFLVLGRMRLCFIYAVELADFNSYNVY
jgi:hypothetical protein